MIYNHVMVENGIKGVAGVIATFALSAKPIDVNDPLDLVGKVLWIIASVLAILWWTSRFYDKYKRRK